MVVRPGEHPVRALDVALLPELPHQVAARLTGTEPLLVQLSRSPAGQLTSRLPRDADMPDLDGDGSCRDNGTVGGANGKRAPDRFSLRQKGTIGTFREEQ